IRVRKCRSGSNSLLEEITPVKSLGRPRLRGLPPPPPPPTLPMHARERLPSRRTRGFSTKPRRRNLRKNTGRVPTRNRKWTTRERRENERARGCISHSRRSAIST
ncbi:hypothetical protein ALC62_05999, partial [Cyphomyrmex costatus]